MKTKIPTGLLTFILASCFILTAVHGYAQTPSISGDSVCGSTAPCTLNDFKKISGAFLAMAMYLGGAVLIIVASIIIILAVKARMQGNKYAIKDAGNRIVQGLIGFILIFLIGGGVLITLVQAFGGQDWTTQLVKLFSFNLVDHAYAADQYLPNPLTQNNAYDVLISGARLIMRFFVYPALIALIVWSGLKFVTSQGKPEGLKEAKAWLWWSVIAIVIVFSLQGFLMAFQATVKQIIPIQGQ